MFVGDFFVWLWDSILWPVLEFLFSATGGVGALVVVGLILGWRVSLVIFPDKRCDRCSGNGSWGPGNLRRECGRCGGNGRVPRVWSGR